MAKGSKMTNQFENVSQFDKWMKIMLFILIILPFVHAKDVNILLVEGDSIHIEYPLDRKISGSYKLGEEGSLHLGIGAAIYLDGLNQVEAIVKVKELVARYYSKTASLKMYVIEKKKRVCVTGQVQSPGFFSMHPDSDIQMLIQAAGGFVDGAKIDELYINNRFDNSFRKVPYQEWIEKKSDIDIEVFNGDCVFVPRSASMGKIHRHLLGYTPPPDESRRNIINVLGEVAKPGAYEINQRVNVLDMIAMAGGPLIPRNSNIIYDLESIQVIKKEGRVFTFNLNKYFATGDENLLIEVESGDNILVPSKKVDVEDRTKVVSVLGAVKKPSSYEISKTIPLQQILARAGGFLVDTNVVISKTDSIIVLRNQNAGDWRQYTYDFDLLLQGYYGDKILLYPDDILFVPYKNDIEISNMKYQNRVTIMGEVVYPGSYGLADSVGLVNLLGIAGGVKQETASGIITIVRVENGNRVRINFNMEGFIHEPSVRNHCRITYCVQDQPMLRPGDVIVIERKSSLYFKEWLDLLWKTATVGIFIYTVMK